jgi:hypothetical protein
MIAVRRGLPAGRPRSPRRVRAAARAIVSNILAEATGKIDSEYFLLPIAGDKPIYRERV